MAKYKVTLTVDGAQIASVNKKLKELYPMTEAHVVEKMKTAQSRPDRLAEAESMMQDAIGIVQELQQEMQDWYDNMPENLQGGGKGDEVQEAADNLQQLNNDLESIDFSSISFPGMF